MSTAISEFKSGDISFIERGFSADYQLTTKYIKKKELEKLVHLPMT